MRRAPAVLVLLLVAATLAAPLLPEAGARPPVKETGFRVVAVDKEGGEVMNASMRVYLGGSGEVSIKPCCRVADDTQYSLVVAVMGVGALLGVDPWSINVSVEIGTTARKLEGPSAGAAFALALIQALRGGEPSRPYVATGQITPELLVAPVGGIEEKHEAALEAGLLLIYPAGNSLANTSGARAAASVPQAYRLATGSAEPLIPVPQGPSPYSGLFAGDAQRLLGEAGSLVSNASQQRLLDMAREAYGHKLYYAASSLAFRALVQARTSRALAEVAENGSRALDALLEEASKRVSEAAEALRNATANNTQSFAALAEAYYRLYEAERSLSEARGLRAEDPAEAARQAVYASLRAETAVLWAGLSKRLSGPPVDSVIASSTAYNYSTAIYRYAEAVAQDFNQTEWLRSYREELDRIHAEAGKALRRGEYARAYGLALGLLDKASTLLLLSMIPRNASSTYLDALWEIYVVLSSQLSSTGSTPFPASLYREYAWFLANESSEALGILASAVDRLVVQRLVELRGLSLERGEAQITVFQPAPRGEPHAAEARILVAAAAAVAAASIAAAAAALLGPRRSSRVGS